jgi:hypothetical protein
VAIGQTLAIGMGGGIALGFLILGVFLAAYAIWYMIFRLGK